MLRTTWTSLLLCAALALPACSEEAVEEKQSPAQPAETQPDPSGPRPEPDSGRGQAGPLNETANAYMARRKPAEPIRSGEVAAEAVGAIVSCAVCHGPQGGGNDALGTPRIGGMPEWYLARQLKYFKTGVRGADDKDPHGIQMRAITLPLADTSLEDLAAHVSDMNPPPAPALGSGDADRGAKLYAVCAACHGPKGRGGAEFNAPGLVDQSGRYLVRQLEHFRTGSRGSHPQDVFGQQMMPIVKSTLTSREDSLDVATYLGSLRNADDSGETGAH